MDIFIFCFYDLLLISCILTGCIFVRKGWPLEYKLLIVLSGLTFLVESVQQICFYILNVNIDWLYNCFLPAECACFIYILYRASVHKVIKRLNLALLMILPIGAGILYWRYPFFYKINDHVVLLYLFTELIGACSFLTGLLLSQSKTPLTHQPLFWLAFGLLIYSGLYIVLHSILYDFLYVNLDAKMTKVLGIYYYLNTFTANLFMYAGFIICFIRLHQAKPGQCPG